MSDRRKTLIKVNVRQNDAPAPQRPTNYMKAVNDVISLMNEKKVSKENAFDVSITSLDDLKEFLNNNENLETKWLRTGEVIGAGAKIYGFRVDNVHSNTYKMISTLARNGAEGDEIQIVGQNDDFSDDEENQPGIGAKSAKVETTTNRKLRKFKFSQSDGEKTMEKLENLDIKTYDLTLMTDPLFKKTRQKFDELGIGNLMTSTLNIDSQLLIQMDSEMTKSKPIKKGELEVIQEEESQNSQQIENLQSCNYLSSLNSFFAKNSQKVMNVQNFKNEVEPKEFLPPLISNDLQEYIKLQDQYVQFSINSPEKQPGGAENPIEVEDEQPEQIEAAPDAPVEYDDLMSVGNNSPGGLHEDDNASGGLDEFMSESKSELADPLCFVAQLDKTNSI